ncbi:MAG: glycosyltransferase family 2 protein [Actinomycetia bacterium]|nr:glycosyltransferase family 2 protein [Actinomycetes bacterium]
MKTVVSIPFRDRGLDPLRVANLKYVADYWTGYGCDVQVVSDGRDGDAPFNRGAAYNRAFSSASDADMFIFAESDLVVDFDQVDRAVGMAAESLGMVVPFSWFMAIGREDSDRVRSFEIYPEDALAHPVKGHRGSIGAVNVMSRRTLDEVGGWDEVTEGWGYDDDIMKIAFDVSAGPTRWVEGSGYHLYHLPGGVGPHLKIDDRRATTRNRMRLLQYQQATTPEQIRELVSSGRSQ